MSAPIVVIGAGIAGLTAAFRLQRTGHEVQILEASSRVGGAIASGRRPLALTCSTICSSLRGLNDQASPL